MRDPGPPQKPPRTGWPFRRRTEEEKKARAEGLQQRVRELI